MEMLDRYILIGGKILVVIITKNQETKKIEVTKPNVYLLK